jgi:hypothetical protein
MALWNEELITGCFARAKADEPMFVLLSRDRLAPWLVYAWACLRTLQIWIGIKPASDFERCDEARALARQMRAWRKANRPKKPAPVMVHPSLLWIEGMPSEFDRQQPETAVGIDAVRDERLWERL